MTRTIPPLVAPVAAATAVVSCLLAAYPPSLRWMLLVFATACASLLGAAAALTPSRNLRLLAMLNISALLVALCTAAFDLGTEQAFSFAVGAVSLWCYLAAIVVLGTRGGLGTAALCAFPLVSLLLPAPWRAPVVVVSIFVLAVVVRAAAAYHDRPLVRDAPDVAAATTYRPALQRSVQLSVVLPGLNPGPALLRTVQGVHAALRSVAHEVIVVDDGSNDGSVELLDPDRDDLVLVRKRNGGKGSALVAGASACRGDHVAYLDADGDIDPGYLAEMLTHIEPGVDLVIGTKFARGALSGIGALRRVYSYGFAVVQRLAGTSVRDSQVGAKIASRELFMAAAHRARHRGFLFDIELLRVARRRTTVRSHPVRITRAVPSQPRATVVLRMFTGTLQLICVRVCGPVLPFESAAQS